MVKTALRGKGTRGGGSASGGNGRSGGAGRRKEPAGERGASGGGAGRGKEPAGERGASRGGGSGRGLSGGGGSGRGGAGGQGPAPEYIPLGELAAIAAARTAKARGKRPTGTSEPVVRPEATSDPVVRPVATRPSPGASSVACEGATNAGCSPVARPVSNGGSCNSSNPSPPSQGTQVSHSNLSHGRTIPLQYPPSTNPQGSSRNVEAKRKLNMRLVGGEVQRDVEAEDGEEEEDRDDDEELQDDAVENDVEAEDGEEEEDRDVEAEDGEEEEDRPDFEAVDEQQPQGLDDEQLLANLLALPGRQRLPLLSEVPVPDSLW